MTDEIDYTATPEFWYRIRRDDIVSLTSAMIASGMASQVVRGARNYEDATSLLIENAAEKVAELDRKCGLFVPDLPTTELMTAEEARAAAAKQSIVNPLG